MFERFTSRARAALSLAQEESRVLGHGFIGTEHILLGLIHEGDGLGAKALEQLGVRLEQVRERVLEAVGTSPSVRVGAPPFTPRAKKVLELALREALQLGHSYIGTEHILLGLVREGEGVAARVLESLGTDLTSVRATVMELLEQYASAPPEAGGPGGVTRRTGTAALEGALSWPRFPRRLVPGPSDALVSEGIVFRVVGMLSFESGIEVLWTISGIPAPLVELFDDLAPPASQHAPLGVGASTYSLFGGAKRRGRVGNERAGSFLAVRDDLGTAYRLAGSSAFEPQANGEWAGASRFVPALSEAAVRVLLEWQRQTIEIIL